MTESAAHRSEAPTGDPVRRAAPWATVDALLRTSAFRFAALYVAAFVVVASFAGLVFTQRIVDEFSARLLETLAVEADGLAELSAAVGETAFARAVDDRARRNPGRLYLFAGPQGQKLAGNLSRWPIELPPANGGTFRYAVGDADARNDGRLAGGVVRTLATGQRLLVARGLDDELAVATRIRWMTFGGFGLLALMGIAGGLWSSRATRARVAAINRTAQTIMAGDLSQRIVASGDGDEFDDLAANLNAMLDRVEQLMAGLREVSDNIAHDLKTPLARLRARAEAALRDPATAESRDALARVIEDADGLLKTFNAMLLVARLEAGALDGTLEAIDVAELVRDVAELYDPVADEAGLSITCAADAPAVVDANRQLIGQAVANLIDNAIKYGAAAAGPATIEIAVTRRGAVIEIEVADHGPGIPKADRARATRRFVRLEASRTKPGTGLGLSLVAAVARLHRGAIELRDNAPGLRVILRLPAAAGAVTEANDRWPTADASIGASSNA